MNASAEPPLIRLADLDAADTLVYGIGNRGRQDDGLGWAFVDWLEQRRLCRRAELHRDYQLRLEDADLIRDRRRVLFVDAAEGTVAGFRLRRVSPRLDFSVFSHSLSLPAVLATCDHCFQRVPDAYLLEIRGHRWGLREGLTRAARDNLRLAGGALLRGCPVYRQTDGDG